ncbi:MAG: UDP-4-amino-4-deoxy-L-arabinose--oxoglutarate aminotransferase [Candidatus Scalindua rubra]|uniref:UDP-4-amino-4-deoxy-L-arabinose--oxoglutarate aminotransferase n=1 Tax=Candidatus Scalindua rubra TaxID=1872076 RepID=A0A1E3XDQ6_9BACT|nr:MAG: UDP-4-amino-4-deoxy-L-arabinose--oxoglutarate aminotransferase [Candidatus Scalindua rubra]
MKIDRIRLFKTSYDNFQSSYYCLSIVLVDDLALKRFEIVKKLNENGVGTSIYYPQPVPLMTYYRRKYGYNENSFPNASLISNSSISLPVGPHLRSEDMDYIVNTFKKVISEV